MALLNLKLTKRGILNIGASCYFNSAMQALITERMIIALEKETKQNNFIYWFKNFDYTSSHVNSIFRDPEFREFGRIFSPNSQADSFDCFQALLDNMMTPEIKTLTNYKYYNKHICENGHIKIFNKGEVIINFAIFTTIPIFISCMNEATSSDRGDAIYKKLLCSIGDTDISCGVCGKKMIEEKITKELPRFLCVRFNDTEFDPRPIPLLPFFIQGHTYIPVSAVYHSSGVSTGGGHYNAIVLRTENSESQNLEYYFIDDDRVHRMGNTPPQIKRGIQYVVYEIH